jgi:hypothetical protein
VIFFPYLCPTIIITTIIITTIIVTAIVIITTIIVVHCMRSAVVFVDETASDRIGSAMVFSSPHSDQRWLFPSPHSDQRWVFPSQIRINSRRSCASCATLAMLPVLTLATVFNFIPMLAPLLLLPAVVCG